jgi:arylsulfatase A-like enzyme
VPFLVQWKGQLPAGKTFAHPVTALDLAPTFLTAADSASRTPHSAFDGLNLLPHLRGEAPLPARPLI